MNRRVYVLAIALALGTWWLAHEHHSPTAGAAAPAPTPGYYFDDADLDETDLHGQRVLGLHARHAIENPKDRSIALSDLSVDYATADATRWHVTADAGTVAAGGESLMLRGNVTVTSDVPRGTAAIIHTDHLLLDRRHKVASTSDPATIDWAPHSLTTVGFRLDLTRRTLLLENTVHGTFRH